MLGDLGGVVLLGQIVAGGQQIQPRHGLLAVKNLCAVDLHRLPARQKGVQIVDGVGAGRRVGLVQAVGPVGRSQGDGGGRAGIVGQNAGALRPVRIVDGYLHTGQRRALAADVGVNL